MNINSFRTLVVLLWAASILMAILFYNKLTAKSRYSIVSTGGDPILFDNKTNDMYYNNDDHWYMIGKDGKEIEVKQLPK